MRHSSETVDGERGSAILETLFLVSLLAIVTIAGARQMGNVIQRTLDHSAKEIGDANGQQDPCEEGQGCLNLNGGNEGIGGSSSGGKGRV
jgi:hypothetical protein